jgi:hypothetical protein
MLSKRTKEPIINDLKTTTTISKRNVPSFRHKFQPKEGEINHRNQEISMQHYKKKEIIK